jgi:hypothetical protein
MQTFQDEKAAKLRMLAKTKRLAPVIKQWALMVQASPRKPTLSSVWAR